MTKKKIKDKPEVFTSPESSNVEGGSYFRQSQQAVIAFRDKKNPDAKTAYYSYVNITPDDWDGLVKADSKGRYMSTVMKKKYRGQLVEG